MDKAQKERDIFSRVCETLSEFSKCESKKVAALAVKNHRVVATGVNGTASGLENCDDHWRKIYDENVVGMSYDEWLKTSEWRKLHHEWSRVHECHAEQQLITEAAKSSVSLQNCEIYLTLEPCLDCSKLLLALKPKAIYFSKRYDMNEQSAREESERMFAEAGIDFLSIETTYLKTFPVHKEDASYFKKYGWFVGGLSSRHPDLSIVVRPRDRYDSGFVEKFSYEKPEQFEDSDFFDTFGWLSNCRERDRKDVDFVTTILRGLRFSDEALKEALETTFQGTSLLETK